MTTRMTAYVAVAMAFVFLMPNIAQSKSVENYKWIEVRSENFVIRSLLSKKQTTKVARHLEMARAVIPESLLYLHRETSVPEVIYLIKGPGQMNEIGHEGLASGHIDYKNAKYMLVAKDVYAEAWAARLYAEFVISDGSIEKGSRWYVSGLASYFRSARVRDGKFRYGGQRSEQPKNPNVIAVSIERMLSDFDYTELSDERRRELSAYSWVLVRYLTDANADWQAFGERIASYNKQLDQGETIQASFQHAFGISVDDIATLLAGFSATCCAEYVVRVDKLLPEFDVEVIKLSREEISLSLAQVAADIGSTDRALELFEIALGDEITRAAAQAGIDTVRSNNSE